MKERFDRILHVYEMTCELKLLLRTGWQRWKLENIRPESVAEHVFGVCMLAVSIYAETDIELDIDKVLLMLMLHETEEAVIGDITFVDPEYKNKREMGKKAVEMIFGNHPRAARFIELIEEFEENKTIEAEFANQCDKFEADLQAEKYSHNFNMDRVEPFLLNHPSILEYKERGLSTVGQFFLESDKDRFTGIFRELSEELARRQAEEN